MEGSNEILEVVRKIENALVIKMSGLVNDMSSLMDTTDYQTIAALGKEISDLAKAIDKIGWGASAIEEHLEMIDEIIKIGDL